MMKKMLLGISLLFPLQLLAADDSVFSWGDWAQGIKPAAGPAVILPAPVQQPNVASLTRSIQVAQEEQVSTVQAIAAAQAAADAAAAQAAAGAAASSRQGAAEGAAEIRSAGGLHLRLPAVGATLAPIVGYRRGRRRRNAGDPRGDERAGRSHRERGGRHRPGSPSPFRFFPEERAQGIWMRSLSPS